MEREPERRRQHFWLLAFPLILLLIAATALLCSAIVANSDTVIVDKFPMPEGLLATNTAIQNLLYASETAHVATRRAETPTPSPSPIKREGL
ncbi:MAG: hypothetical protein IT324_20305 [Anaerolineae bacterium]|nr:hypothetical protein [Anaerolineae bacterium]